MQGWLTAVFSGCHTVEKDSHVCMPPDNWAEEGRAFWLILGVLITCHPSLYFNKVLTAMKDNLEHWDTTATLANFSRVPVYGKVILFLQLKWDFWSAGYPLRKVLGWPS